MDIADLPEWVLQVVWGLVGFYIGAGLAVSVLGVSVLPIVIGIVFAVVIGLVGTNVTQRFVAASD